MTRSGETLRGICCIRCSLSSRSACLFARCTVLMGRSADHGMHGKTKHNAYCGSKTDGAVAIGYVMNLSIHSPC